MIKGRLRRILISCAIVIIVVLGFYNFLIKVKIKQIHILEQKHADTEKLLNSSKECIKKYKDVKIAFEHISYQWRILEKCLPEEEEMPDLLRAISNVGKKSNVKSLLFTPLVKVPKDFYQDNPIQVKTTSGYHEIGTFLSMISELQRLVNVSKLRLIASKNIERTLEAEFIATAYTTKK